MPLKSRLRRLLRRAISGIWSSDHDSLAAAESWENADHAATASPDEQIRDPWDPHAALREDGRRKTTAPGRPATAASSVQPPLPFNDPTQLADVESDEPTDLRRLAIQAQVVSNEAVKGREETPRSGLDGEFADPVDDLPDLDTETLEAEDWGLDVFEVEDASRDDLGLYVDDYTEGAHRPPVVSAATPHARAARMKAAQIVDLIQPRTAAERQEALTYLTDLFEHLAHPATYAAIQRLAPCLNLDTMRAMVEFRDAWLQNDSWHLHRYGREIAAVGTHSGGFTWTLAYRLCVSRSSIRRR